tara:strand:+ start:26 stop:313 length:288 start_codon:yes stop_codon:yes gene_type:complete
LEKKVEKMQKLIVIMLSVGLLGGCTVKPEFLREQQLQEQAQKEVRQRQDDWNWKNRQRLQKEKREFLERADKKQKEMNKKRRKFAEKENGQIEGK